MSREKMSAVLYSISAILFIVCAVTGDEPAFYGVAAVFIALAAIQAPKGKENMRKEENSVNQIIIYGSHYGSTKQYAEKLSEQTGIPAIPYQDKPTLSGIETVIYLGGLYAGGVAGLKKTFRNVSLCEDQRLIIVTVGLADPMETENQDNICSTLQKQLSPAMFRKAKIYHLRDSIDYSKLSFAHRTAMKLLYQTLRKKPAETLTAEDRALIDTYGKCVSFIDFDTINPIIKEILES